MLLLGGIMVAIVVAVMIVASVVTARGGADSRLSQSWTVPKPDAMGRTTTVVAYPTVDEKTFVRVDLYGVTGYDMATGRARWQVDVPQGDAVCASTHDSPDGVAAVAYGSGDKCTVVMAVDIAAGRRLWSATPRFADSSDPPESAALAAVGGRIYVTNTERLVGYDARTGPNGDGAAEPVEASPRGVPDCHFSGVTAAKDRLATVEECGGRHRYLVGLDPTTLHPAFRTALALDRHATAHVVSVHPLVLHATNALAYGELRIFDDAGTQTKVFSSRHAQGTLILKSQLVGGYNDDNVAFPVRVVGNTLVALVAVADDDDKTERKVAGVDLRSATWSWTSSLDTRNIVDMAFGDDPREVTLFAEGGRGPRLFSRDERRHVLQVDPARGEVSAGHSLDLGDSTENSVSGSVYTVRDRVLVLRVVTAFDGPIITTYGG